MYDFQSAVTIAADRIRTRWSVIFKGSSYHNGFMRWSLVFIFNLVLAVTATGSEIKTLNEAIPFLNQHLDLFDNKTIYCSCSIRQQTVDLKSCGYKVQGDRRRAQTLEWEHVVPPVVFGKNFLEWRFGAEKCVKRGRKFTGRACAQTNPEFQIMESDLYNLFPELFELKWMRSTYPMATLVNSARNFGGCKVKLAEQKFQPQEASRGIVARTYINLDRRYKDRGILNVKNRKLMEEWNQKYPVTPLECKRWKALEEANGYRHYFMDKCGK